MVDIHHPTLPSTRTPARPTRPGPDLGMRRRFAVLAGVALLLLALGWPAFRAGATGPDDWIAIKDHAVVEESTGWQFPVDIAFVPEPGSDPKAPLYYVTELRGTIKVVSNDRTVSVYAERVNAYRPQVELPEMSGETGLAGVCLDPRQGTLFATTVYAREGLLYNKIVRFEHTGKTFERTPARAVAFTRIFDRHEAAVSHQIGKCVVAPDGTLYVGVGDGMAPASARDLDSPNGKILHLNPDFSAPADNPFYDPARPDAIAGYVYAYGLRNPFGIALDDGGVLYAADNGIIIDRLVEVMRGRDYFWNGDDRAIATGGVWFWRVAVGPAGAIHLGRRSAFAAWRGRVVVAQGGTINQPGPSRNDKITLVSYPVRAGHGLTALPETLVSYRGNYRQLLVPVAEGPDGLYFSGFFPDPSGVTRIMKLVPRPGASPPTVTLYGATIYQDKGCDGCHRINGIGGAVGPALDGLVDRLGERLASPAYAAQLATADALAAPPFPEYRAARERLRTLAGEARVGEWIALHLREPRFDFPNSQMPNPRLTSEEIGMLSEYLLTLRRAPPSPSSKP